MKFLLLNPPPKDTKLITDASVSREVGISSFEYVYPPLGLMYVAALLERNGHSCRIIDGNVEDAGFGSLDRMIKRTRPDVLAVQMPPSLMDSYSAVLRRLKEGNRLLIAYMGPFPTMNAGRCLEYGADFVVRGEPELTLLELGEALERGGDAGKIRGISYKEGKPVHNPDRELIGDLDGLPYPARHLIDNGRYFIPFANEPFTTIITSRGCPHQCIFCPTRIYFGNTLRLRSIGNVIGEIRECVERYGLRHICFWDDTFNVDMNRAKRLCRAIIRERLRIRWFCLSRVDKVDEELVRLMRLAGCYNIQYGVESASQRVLDNIKKGITVEQIEKAFAMTKKRGISTTGFFMFGNLGETPETMMQTIRFARKLNPDYARFCLATPFPGTEFHEIIRGKFKQEWERSDILHSMDMEHASSRQMDAALDYAYRSFYLRPGFILKEMLKIRSLNGVNYRIKQAGWLLRNTLAK
jgi:anaerobic magnesium-protoporphyrin IX monomethyl ester cyclase